MKVYLLSAQDWDGVEPISLHRSLDVAKAKAERLRSEHHAEVRARGGRIVKEYEHAQWVDHGDGWWEYGGWQVDEMEVEG
jgi:ABC-type uncharacterized transport system auxiliary subunit